MLLNNKYEFDPEKDQIGKGGFGNVFKAKDTVLDRKVALKLVDKNNLPPKYSLVAEISRVIELQHTNLVRFYDAFIYKASDSMGRETEVQVGVMEYINHGDLTKLCGRPNDIPDLNTFLKGILEGLGYLQSKGIIHRDIKPANIMIRKDGDLLIPKIADFGISKNLSDAGSTVSGLVGTHAYMSPEQLNNTTGKLSPASDIWAFGIMLYELFIGERPFDKSGETSNAQIISNIMECKLPERVNTISEPYQSIIKKCVTKDLKQRVNSTDDVLNMFKPKRKKTVNNTTIQTKTLTKKAPKKGVNSNMENVITPPPPKPNNEATRIETPIKKTATKNRIPKGDPASILPPPPISSITSTLPPPPVQKPSTAPSSSNLSNKEEYDTEHEKSDDNPFVGRSGRMEYWIEVILCSTIFFFVNRYVTNKFWAGEDIPGWTYWVRFVLGFTTIAAGFKRCHDLGHTGWYQFIPFYFFVMLFGKGKEGANKYGSAPK